MSITDDFIVAVGIGGTSLETHNLVDLSDSIDSISDDYLFVTYNGENYRGGFDFPWLRSKFILNNLQWSFRGKQHLDLYPLIQKYIWTKTDEVVCPSKSKISAKVMRTLAEANNVLYTNKNETYDKLIADENTNWFDLIEIKAKESNDLQSVYQMLFDPKCEEEYISGADSKKLLEVGKKEDIVRHCYNDVKRLKKVFNAVVDMIPEYELQRNIKEL